MKLAKKVLIVDDEDDVCSTVKEMVKNNGFEAETAKSAEEALEVLKHKKFDLVLMDIYMPGMAGTEAVEAMRDDPKLKDQKVAFLTVAKVVDVGKELIERLKPADYIQKPLDFEDFSKRLKKLLE